MIIVSNASPLINISRLKLFHHLPVLYKKLVIPEAVVKEVVEKGCGYFDSGHNLLILLDIDQTSKLRNVPKARDMIISRYLLTFI